MSWTCANYTEGAVGIGAARLEVFHVDDRPVVIVTEGEGSTPSAMRAAEISLDYLRSALGSSRGASRLMPTLRALDHHLFAHPEAGSASALVVMPGEGEVRGAGVGSAQAWLIAQSGGCEVLSEGLHRAPLLGSGEARPMAFHQPVAEGERLLVASAAIFEREDHPERRVREGRAGAALMALVHALREPGGGVPADLACALLTPLGVPAPSPAPRSGGAAPAITEASDERVLFADGHASFARAAAQSFLAELDIHYATTLAEALALDLTAFHWVFVSDTLEDGSGVSLVRSLRAQGVSMPIIAVSGRERSNTELIEAGADAACPKMKFRAIREVMERLRGG